MKKIYPTEEQEHFSVCDYLRKVYPDVIFLTDGSGLWMPINLAKKFKQLRNPERGIPDIIILHPKFGYKALIIEMKKQNGKIFLKDGKTYVDDHIREQAELLERLYDLGFYACFALGASAAIETIDRYMTGTLK